MTKADRTTDLNYKVLHDAHDAHAAKANGYRSQGFFLREQNVVMDRLLSEHLPIVDIACGTGLMLQPIVEKGVPVIGIDFNARACGDANQNGINVIRGDAFDMPFAENSIAQAVNCQFLNQQKPDTAERFIYETARMLKPGGRLILLWRHARSLTHRTAHAIFRFFDMFGGQPAFPQYTHPLCALRQYAMENGLDIIEQSITLPLVGPNSLPAYNLFARLFGASFILVLEKPKQ